MENSTGTVTAGTADHSATDRSILSAESEQPTLAAAHQLKHSHKPNFGRFVADCPKCEANPPKPRQPKVAAKVAATEGGVYITYEQLQALMAGQIGAQIDGLKEFARELRKPDPEEQERRQKEKARLEQRKQRRLAEIRIEAEAKIQRQQFCAAVGHKKENGKTAVYMGQEFSDGFYHPFCHRCGMDFPLVKHTPGAA